MKGNDTPCMAGLDIENMRYATTVPKRFSQIELRDIAVSILALSLAFLLMFRSTDFVTAYFKFYLGDLWAAGMFGMMVFIVVLSFFTHELGHKFTAQRMGLWSEYRMFPMGLIIAVLMSMFGFLFAAPGVVYIRGFVDTEQDGKISMAGPATNIVLAVVGLALAMALNGQPLMVPFYLLFILNASLALFNLLPFGILDGAKILRWNSSVWTLMIIVAGVLFCLRMFGMLPAFEYTLG